MTHDELLAKINEPDHWFKPFLDIRKALRSVVELHTPNEWGICYTCNIGDDVVRYPCETIQVIEKELNSG